MNNSIGNGVVVEESSFLQSARAWIDGNNIEYTFPISGIVFRHRRISVEDMVVRGLLPEGVTPKTIADIQVSATKAAQDSAKMSDDEKVKLSESALENMSTMAQLGKSMIMSSMIGNSEELEFMRDKVLTEILPVTDVLDFLNNASGSREPEQDMFQETSDQEETELAVNDGQLSEEIPDISA